MTRPPTVEPFGDEGFLVTFGDSIDVETNDRVHAAAAAIERRRAIGDERWGRAVPAYATLLVPVRRGAGMASLRRALSEILATEEESDRHLDGRRSGSEVRIDVRYGGGDGPDLDGVAAALRMTASDVVAEHTAHPFRVFMLGFSPGFAYLGVLPESLRLPRRETPRLRVPAGSVAIAAAQTAIYPSETPGGWHLIGRTNAPLWDVTRNPPALLQPGASVRFRAL